MKKENQPAFKFDKFVKDIQKREEKGKENISKHLEGQEVLPQRKYNRLYREDWRNRVKFRRK
jgi:hypothetical protein